MKQDFQNLIQLYKNIETQPTAAKSLKTKNIVPNN